MVRAIGISETEVERAPGFLQIDTLVSTQHAGPHLAGTRLESRTDGSAHDQEPHGPATAIELTDAQVATLGGGKRAAVEVTIGKASVQLRLMVQNNSGATFNMTYIYQYLTRGHRHQ